jgi:V/A-type H+-transporting ATPase subunit C
MSSDYGYINARVRAMKSRLLPRETLFDLLSAPDLAALGGALGGTAYGKELSEAQSHAAGLAAVEEGLRRNLCQATAKLQEIMDGRPGELFDILLGRWDLENIKAVLRGKHRELAKDAILTGVLPAGRLEEGRLTELAGAEDLKAVADMLATWHSPFARPLTRALPAYLQNNRLADLELALDRFYFASGLEATRKGDGNTAVVRDLLKEETDLVNLRTALRLRGEALEEQTLVGYWMAEGNWLSERRFVALARAESFSQALDQASLAFSLPERPGNEAELENALARALAKGRAGLYRGDPLSIRIPLGYLWMKANEVTNLRLIARGKAYGLARDEIEKELLLN